MKIKKCKIKKRISTEYRSNRFFFSLNSFLKTIGTCKIKDSFDPWKKTIDICEKLIKYKIIKFKILNNYFEKTQDLR